MCKRSLVRACIEREFQRSSLTSERPLWITDFPRLSGRASGTPASCSPHKTQADFLELTASFHKESAVGNPQSGHHLCQRFIFITITDSILQMALFY